MGFCTHLYSFVKLNPKLYVCRLVQLLQAAARLIERRGASNESFRIHRTVALLLVTYLTISEQTVSDGAISDFGLPSTDGPMSDALSDHDFSVLMGQHA